MAESKAITDIEFQESPLGEMTYPDAEQKIVAKYDVHKNYEWQPQDEFTFNGMEFNIMYNNMSEFMTGVTTPASILKLADVFAVLQSRLINAVETGQVRERASGTSVEQNAKPESVQ